MKLIFSLCVISLSISLFLIQSNSFTKADISNKVLLAIVDEENAIIGITYEKNKMFKVTNNTGDTIEIDSIEILDRPDQKIIELDKMESSQIQPDRAKKYIITGNPKELIGGLIKLTIRWNGGSAEIKSTIQEQIAER
ncbi:hypothetical protein [Neobacillus drentensis]|uniref:hypothetical protein n=1 Tax=Neobacillus drentensis TaxID=220684 RepID=UPI00285B6A3B|nr:hypothetical protein [Neobacillus drentensis]MDR7239077.1 hypothetical protein [Neobacillus drentensis]